MSDLATPRVSDLVIATIEASCDAISQHYSRLFDATGADGNFEAEYWLAKLLEDGERFDIDDDAAEIPNPLRFSHLDATRIFYRHLSRSLRSLRAEGRIMRGIDKHLWSQDYERRLRSLFPRGLDVEPSEAELRDARTKEHLRLRTRVSAIVQQSLLHARLSFHSEKASTAFRGPQSDSPRLFVPSPMFVARQVLTDPESPASEVYALAAGRVELTRRVEQSFGVALELSYDRISVALETIKNRSITSKPLRQPTPETAFLCHYLAMKGAMSLFSEWDAEKPENRTDRLLRSPESLFDTSRGALQFRLHPDYEELPNGSELMNELHGLPVPLEGGTTIFSGGIRFGTGGDIVAAISGPFGAGKTTSCLSLASALAPLGCRTLFFSCEESQDDIERRLAEAAPEQPLRSTPLFRCLDLKDFRNAAGRSAWFQAHQLRVTGADASSAIEDLIALFRQAWQDAPIFEPFRDRDDLLPPFARPVVVVDGFHQLARECGLEGHHAQVALRRVIDACRELDGVFLFTVAQGDNELRRLDYLCDLVIELDRAGFDSPEEHVTRLFRLLKARRQPCRVGTHVFHLTGPKSLRIKANVAARAELAKNRKWVLPDRSKKICLLDREEDIELDRNSQILIYGSGSTGKAGLGLYILHRRPVETFAKGGEEPRLFSDLQEWDEDLQSNVSRQADPHSFDRRRMVGMPDTLPFYEARTLVLSFLYPPQYFRALSRLLRRVPKRRDINRDDYRNLPDRAIVDTIALYPGALRPEDLLAKIENSLTAAELRGIPYTGVLIDGIHNVFVQFPRLEADRSFWPQLYSMLRTRSVTVVTTHTRFELKHAHLETSSFSAEFEDAQRKSGPLLSVLVSGADYALELAHSSTDRETQYQLYARTVLGRDPPVGFLEWDRQNLRFRGRFTK